MIYYKLESWPNICSTYSVESLHWYLNPHKLLNCDCHTFIITIFFRNSFCEHHSINYENMLHLINLTVAHNNNSYCFLCFICDIMCCPKQCMLSSPRLNDFQHPQSQIFWFNWASSCCSAWILFFLWFYTVCCFFCVFFSVDESVFYFFSVSLQICVGLYIGLLNRNIEKEFA